MGHSDKPLYIFGSALVGLMLIIGFNTFLSISEQSHHGQPADGYTLPAAETKETAAAAPAAEKTGAPEDAAPAAGEAAAPATADAGAGGAGGDIATLVASADVEKGKKLFKRCAACHSFKKSDPSKTGPNLHGVVDRDVASLADYADKYSAAMKSKGGKWTLADLDAFVTKPKNAVPGTAMIFPGIKQDNKRADLLAYIKTLSD